MPSFATADGPLTGADVRLLAVGATRREDAAEDAPPELGPGGAEVADALGVDLAAELTTAGFDASVGSVTRVPTRGAVGAPTVLVAGLGDPARVTLDTLRRAAAEVAAASERTSSLATTLHATVPAGADPADAVQAVVEGVGLGAYRFHRYKSGPTAHQLDEVRLHPGGRVDATALDAGRHSGEVTLGAAVLVRDLVNTPPRDKRPAALAERIEGELAGTGVQVRILDERDLADGGYGGLLGVGAGSSEPPRLVELAYAPAGADRHVALVGKGITFDTGGLSLKPNEGMVTMKTDMSGAATVAAAVRAAAALELPVRVTGLLALAENMPSGTATRPSDVLTIRGGTTVEVLNTDAEGRLVLADALVHASEASPDAIIDVATLTGAVVHALGNKIGALMTDDDALAEGLLDAGTYAGEPLWRLPVATAQYGEELDSDVADIKNAGWKGAGTIRAGLFLQRFVGEGIPWAHLDIAGVAWADEPDGYLATGATGVPARTLVRWLTAA